MVTLHLAQRRGFYRAEILLGIDSGGIIKYTLYFIWWERAELNNLPPSFYRWRSDDELLSHVSYSGKLNYYVHFPGKSWWGRKVLHLFLQGFYPLVLY